MDDELALALPQCGECRVGRLEPAGTDERPYWECPSCGWIALAV